MRKHLKNKAFIFSVLLVCFLFFLLIKINSQLEVKNIERKRQQLVRFIFKAESLPTGYPQVIIPHHDSISKENAEKYTVYMANDIISESYFYRSKNNSSKLMIFVSGHFCEVLACHSKEISYFLEKNYSVLAFSLPSSDNNASHSIHRDLGRHDSGNFSMISYFVEPIALSLNFVNDKYRFEDISMTGISGGGWVTTIYAAIDERVKKSFPLAGTLPMDYLSEDTYGDYEYRLESLYELANYYDLYMLGSVPKGRSQVQILNLDDECCFQGSLYLKKPYGPMIKRKLKSLSGGTFEVIIINQSSHAYSEEALSIITKKTI